jgi:hypothetical protein
MITSIDSHPESYVPSSESYRGSVTTGPGSAYLYSDFGFASRISYEPVYVSWKVGAVIGAVIAAVALVVIAILAVFLWRLISQRMTIKYHEIESREMRQKLIEMREYQQQQATEENVDKWVIHMEDVELQERIEEGSYGVVFKVSLLTFCLQLSGYVARINGSDQENEKI